MPSLAMAFIVMRLPEPARGGSSRIPAGEPWTGESAAGASAAGTSAAGRPEAGKPGLAEQAVRRADVQPQPELVLRADPTDRSVWWAVRYVLRVRTNVVIIAASALAYFFFAGLRSFATRGIDRAIDAARAYPIAQSMPQRGRPAAPGLGSGRWQRS